MTFVNMLRPILALVLSVFVLAAYSASFDCTQATFQSEKIICSDPDLSELDEQLFSEYSRAKTQASDPEQLKKEQISWIKEVRTCDANESCIENLYTQRIKQLAQAASQRNNESLLGSQDTATSQATSDAASNPDTGNNLDHSPRPPDSNQHVVLQPPTSDQRVVGQSANVESNKTNTPSKLISQAYSADRTALGIMCATGILLFGVSFFIYAKCPKLRNFSIPPPFDIGCASKLTETQHVVKSKRQSIEFQLLFLSVIVYFLLWIFARGNESFLWVFVRDNEPRVYRTILASPHTKEILTSLFSFAGAFGVVVIGRSIAGNQTRCPKCKNAFAKELVNRYSEPKSTYEMRGNRREQFVAIMETGIDHAHFICSVCSHEWHTAKQYRRQVSHYFPR